ncbi:MAG TPA: ATP-binding protein [Rhodopila sp.]|jgi:two-component system phosphate regulon sensor histidine kinase PhoR|nr:ATP-binding protein [Rhodopila sp.]
MRRLGIVFCLAGAPVATLIFLAVAEWADFWPAMVGICVSLLSAGIFALVWARDQDVLTEALRRIAADGPSPANLTEAVTLMGGLGREIERLCRRLAARAALQERYRRADTVILEKLPDPVLVLARDRSVRRSNAAARLAFGDDLPAVLRNPALRDAIGRALGSHAAQTAELGLRAPVPRDILATVVSLDPPLADGGELLVVLSDRTRERAVERMRADFVANVSHELRTPLSSLIGFIETLRGPAADDPPAQQRFLAIMAEQGARMNRLIDDLLSLSRIELMEHQTPSEPLDLGALARRVADGFEPRLREHQVTLELSVEDDLPVVRGDADQLEQVLQNLLDNALKYGRDGGTIGLRVGLAHPRPPGPSRPGLTIAVADQGAGIPKEHLPRLTERFYRVNKGRSRAMGGTGLGLAIVKHIVNRHRGQLLIDSEEGKGTTVSIWLPVAADRGNTQPGASS